jgi:hypothetical protein
VWGWLSAFRHSVKGDTVAALPIDLRDGSSLATSDSPPRNPRTVEEARAFVARVEALFLPWNIPALLTVSQTTVSSALATCLNFVAGRRSRDYFGV